MGLLGDIGALLLALANELVLRIRFLVTYFWAQITGILILNTYLLNNKSPP